MNQAELNPVNPVLVPRGRWQMAAIAGLRWRTFVNSLRTFRGRLELASRIFVGIAFAADDLRRPIKLCICSNEVVQVETQF